MPRGGKREGAGRKQNSHKASGAPLVSGQVSRGYDAHVALQAKKLCELGATTVELADFFGVSVSTINRWAIEFSDFCASLRAGKDAADDRVERSLYHRAVGYTFDSVKIMAIAGKAVTIPFREHVPPDVGAATLWLKNRRKEQWRDKQDHEHSGTVNLVSKEQRDATLAAALRADS